MHQGARLSYIAYLDEFGHIGPFIGRHDDRHNGSPVFGLAGIVLPTDEVRSFGTWFFQLKSNLLAWEISRDKAHPATWEKKGSSLYTEVNITRYRELRTATNRLLSKVHSAGGFVFYVGLRKTAHPDRHNPNYLYVRVLLEAIKRLNAFCELDCDPMARMLIALDEHDQRDNLMTAASRSMYGGKTPYRRIIEPPFELESHRYQTMQAADWIAGLIGRFGAYWAAPDQYGENEVFLRYFGQRVQGVVRRSGIRT